MISIRWPDTPALVPLPLVRDGEHDLDPLAELLLSGAANAAWLVVDERRGPIGWLVGRVVPLDGRSPGEVRRGLRASNVLEDPDERIIQTHAGPALRLVQRFPQPFPERGMVVATHASWSWHVADSIAVLSTESMEAVNVEAVIAIVDQLAAIIRFDD